MITTHLHLAMGHSLLPRLSPWHQMILLRNDITLDPYRIHHGLLDAKQSTISPFVPDELPSAKETTDPFLVRHRARTDLATMVQNQLYMYTPTNTRTHYKPSTRHHNPTPALLLRPENTVPSGQLSQTTTPLHFPETTKTKTFSGLSSTAQAITKTLLTTLIP